MDMEQGKKKITIMHAGSLGRAFSMINAEFQRIHPDVEVIDRAGGSAALVRDVAAGKECGILASADYNLIDRLLLPDYTDWCVCFATNRMVIRYTKESRYSDEINSSNWYEILLREGVTFWHMDADGDPGGYRALMVMQLAEKYYGVPNLYTRLMDSENHRLLTRETREESRSGYIFGYDSRSQDNDTMTLNLPDEINLSRIEFKEFYRNAVVKITGIDPGEKFDLHGTPILFVATVPKSTQEKELCFEWLQILLGEQGRTILDKVGMSPIAPYIVGDRKTILDVFS